VIIFADAVNYSTAKNTCCFLTETLAQFCALRHEKSYPRVGFFPIFFPHMGGPEHRSPLRSCAFLSPGKIDLRRWMGTISREVGLFLLVGGLRA
jgi:hypothetical protein